MAEREPQAIPAEPNASEQPHDVLAAEEFAMPAPEEARHRGPIVLPPEPNPSDEPHDVLAAEEFAMPAPEPRPPFAPAPASRRSKAVPLLAGLGALVLLRQRLYRHGWPGRRERGLHTQPSDRGRRQARR